eukprot:31212-Pelagococcus_subviridis.AAC.10
MNARRASFVGASPQRRARAISSFSMRGLSVTLHAGRATNAAGAASASEEEEDGVDGEGANATSSAATSAAHASAHASARVRMAVGGSRLGHA